MLPARTKSINYIYNPKINRKNSKINNKHYNNKKNIPYREKNLKWTRKKQNKEKHLSANQHSLIY